MLPLLALVAAGAPAVANARAVRTGSTVKVTREVSVPMKQGFWAVRHSDDEVQLVVYPNEVAVGALFDLVDETGWVARARVESVTRTNDGCPRYTYTKAQARIIEKGGRDSSSHIAVGPMDPDGARAQRIHRQYGGQVTGLPSPGQAVGLQYAVDLDGDGQVDLARYVYDCAGGPNVSFQNTRLGCVDDYSREGSQSWRLVQHGEIRCM